MNKISGMHLLGFLFLMVPLCLAPIGAFADPTEDIFGRAVRYTVQIKTAGAGFTVENLRWVAP